jgi:tetratricopeptide (TPR) repeat protein
MSAQGTIFLSYRRDDGGFARDLYEKLRDWFDEDELFLDHENLAAGVKFRPELDQAIRECSVFLAVIGPQWLSDKNRQRLHEADDITRGEIRAALAHGKAIIPVLAGGAGFPAAAELPADLQGMTAANAHHQLEAQYRACFQTLLDTLERKHGLKPRYRRRDGRRQPFYVAGMQQSPHFVDPAHKLPALHGLLAENDRAALTATTVQGMGGVGKTQLALRFSHLFRDEYDGVWWFRAEENTGVQEDCLELCRELDIARYDNEDPSRSVARWLKKQPRWLLVYDNVEDAAALAAHLPEAGGHHIIVTTHQHELHDLAAAALDLAAWSDDQALDFLRPRLPAADDDERRALTRALGGLPLALEQACAYLGKTKTAVAGYLAAIEDFTQRERLLARSDSALCPRSVQATLSLAFERLSEPARELLRLCAWLAPEPIPEWLFTESPDELPQTLVAVAGDELAWGETVADLAGYGLCQQDGGGKTLAFHRLTQVAAQVQERGKGDCRYLQVLLEAVWPGDTSVPVNWPRYAVLLPHVIHLDGLLATGWLDRVRHSYRLDRIASYLRQGPALYAESERWYRRAWAIVRDELGDEHPDTLACMSNLATTLYAIGNWDSALDLQKSALAIRRRVFGEEHPETLTAKNNLAVTYMVQGDLAGAFDLQKSALAGRRRVLGEEHPDTFSTMSNLASILQLQGDLAGAIELEKSALAGRRRLLGEDHPDTLIAMNNLATSLHLRGDLAGALELHESELAICRRVLGDEHPDTLSSLTNLGSACFSMGNLPRALELATEALAGARRKLGDRHPHTLQSIRNLAKVYTTLDNPATARALRDELAALDASDANPDTPGQPAGDMP